MPTNYFFRPAGNTFRPIKWKLFLMIIIISEECIASCRSSPPQDPIKCSSIDNSSNCTVTNVYGTFPDRSVCHAAIVAYPATEQDLVSIVANATKNKRKMKVATRSSHSIPKLVCLDGQDGLLISTKNLNRVLQVDNSTMTVTVEPGVLLKDLINEAAKGGLALPYTPYWWGLTVGGLLGTGAHGSTLWDKGSAVHEYVVQLRIVTPATPEQGYAIVRTLNDGDPDLNAARVSLGVLGVISQVTLKMQPMFKRSITFVTASDADLGDQVSSFGRQHEFADIQWYPSQRKLVYRMDDRVSINSSGNGLMDELLLRSTPSALIAISRTLEETQEALRDDTGKCFSGRLSTLLLERAAFGLTNDGTSFTGYPVIGYQNRLQASGSCLTSSHNSLITTCPWDPRVHGLFYFNSAFSVDLSKVSNFIRDVQKLVEISPHSLCGFDIYSGILMRYITRSNAYLGKQEDGIDFDITYYRSHDPNTPRLYEDVFEEIEQMAVFKYGALPHWGKNQNVVFEGAINKYVRANEFFKVKYKYDPLGLFSSEWTDRVLGLKGKVSIVREGCGLEGLCVCSLDSHCAPNKGYFCRPGKVYKDARVCTLISDSTTLLESM